MYVLYVQFNCCTVYGYVLYVKNCPVYNQSKSKSVTYYQVWMYVKILCLDIPSGIDHLLQNL